MRFRGISQFRGLLGVSDRFQAREQVCVPVFSYEALYTLSVIECICEDYLRLVQTAYTLAKEEVCSCVQCVSEHQIKGVDLLAPGNLGDKDLGVLFEDVDVAEAILHELWSN